MSGTILPQHNQTFSARRYFSAAICVLLAIGAFPLYQAVTTGGFVFYTNGVDESAYLSYPFSQTLLTWPGVLRHSARLVIFLHEAGLSAGWINFLLDILATILVLTLLPVALRHWPIGPGDRRRWALLIFLIPVLLTPFNPVIEGLEHLRRSTPLFQWTALPTFPDLLFLRTPEPQLSWILLMLLCAAYGRTRSLPLLLCACTPFMYSIIRPPLLFVSLVLLIPRAIPLSLRLIFSFVATGLLTKLFIESALHPAISRFAIMSYAPVVPFTGILSIAAYLALRPYVSASLRPLLLTLVSSTWVGPNLQVVSGYMTSPPKYEEYYGVIVVSLLLGLLILLRSKRPNVWVGALLITFLAWTVGNAKVNHQISSRLVYPRGSIELLHTDSDRAATSDLLLSSLLDMVHPRQPSTLFSYTRTYDVSSHDNFERYRCGKRLIKQLPAHVSSAFAQEFAQLDAGYIYRGVGETVTMRRVPLDRMGISLPARELLCSYAPPIIIPVR